MKIVICGSMSSSKEMVEIANELKKTNHKTLLPRHAVEYTKGNLAEENSHESTKNKIEQDLIRDYYEEIKNADAVLVANISKKGIENYVGGNTFLEMAFAHVLDKKIYSYNDIPDMLYTDEIKAMQPIVINQDLSNIK